MAKFDAYDENTSPDDADLFITLDVSDTSQDPGGRTKKLTLGDLSTYVVAEAGAGDMVSTNNLSDVADAATSRTNLGLGTAATTDATAYDTAGAAAAAQAASQPLDADLTTIAAADNGSVLAATTASFLTADQSTLDTALQNVVEDLTPQLGGDLDVNGNAITGQTSVDLTPGTAPSYVEGRVFYDSATDALTVFDDQSETSLQVGQEVRVRVFNANGVTVPNGAAVSVTGVTVGGIVEVELADASDKTSALNTIGIATHDIEAGTEGWATTSGMVNGVDTSALTEGAAIYLSDSTPGGYTETRPLSPSYEVRMGGVAVSSATVGKLYAELRIIGNDQDNNSFLNGAILEPNTVSIVSNGTTINCALTSQAANSRLSLIFDQEYISVASGININLTPGTTDASPIENWVWIDPAGTITKGTSGFPTGTQFVPVARVVCPTAATAQTYGVYKTHAYTDHLQDSVGQGHLSHVNAWIRKRPASWQNGVVLTQSVAEGTPAATIDLSYTSGTISQLHDHTFPAINTATKPAFVVNDSTTAYALANGITSAIDTDSAGAAIGNNKFYNLVVWAVVSQQAKDCQLFFNLPSGSYTQLADALADVDTYSDYTIPVAYLGTGFLVTKLTVQRGASTVTVPSGGTTDLRGSIPAVGGGSVIGGGGITVFDSLTDSPATKVGSSLDLVRVNVGETALEYVDGSSVYLPLTGGTVSGALTVPTPTVDTHAATKKYVDDAIAAAIAAL